MKKYQKVLNLRPTQFAVGMLEVQEKLESAKKLNKKALRKYVEENPVPVVVGPDRDLYLVDHHHFLAVCYHRGVRKVRIKVVKNLSLRKLNYLAFWKWMFKTRNAYPYCQFGEGPRKAIYLPRDIRGVADDPYRSLAWYVRKSGAFKDSERNYAEFLWANFFRGKGLLDREGINAMPKAIVKAVSLAQSPAAKKLPGYGKLNLEEQKKTVKEARHEGKRIKSKERK